MRNEKELAAERIAALLSEKKQVLVAIDGNCASGKTTLAGELAGQFSCCLIHMDDFFLRNEQRTPERLQEVGGNVDYERFREQALEPLRRGEAFSYQKFDCPTKSLKDWVEVKPCPLVIIEGSYSMHPYFGDPYDLKIFLELEYDRQIERIRKRNGEAFLKRFAGEWIPKENAYFREMKIKEKVDIIIRG